MQTRQLAQFVAKARYDHLSSNALDQLKIRVLDTLGVAIGALHAEPILLIRDQVNQFGGHSLSTLIGGGFSAPDRAAFFNGALARYLDFNDSFLSVGETCHPSDNLAAVLAAAEYANLPGKDFLAALAVAYQVQIRLSEAAPLRARGFDHVSHGAFAVAAGVSHALALDAERTANALAMSGASHLALRVTRTGFLSHWKGLAYAHMAAGATSCAFLAMRGITGPARIFEGARGFEEVVSGPFEIDWDRENIEGVCRTSVKKYNAEIHSQSAIEAVLELREKLALQPGSDFKLIERIEIEIFSVAYEIIGGGGEPQDVKKVVRTKEQADHSLPYLVAVAMLDGQVLPEQYETARIARADVQGLLKKVSVKPAREFSEQFPREIPVRVRITLSDGRELQAERAAYEGYASRPMPWPAISRKFNQNTEAFASASLRREIEDVVRDLEATPVRELTRLLANAASVATEKRSA